jgi:hypothetical protein
VVSFSGRRSFDRRVFVTVAAVARTASLRTAVSSADYVIQFAVRQNAWFRFFEQAFHGLTPFHGRN